ncbi:MAG: class I SAM-dependent methyltransferase [Flavobacteriaceae bacterium]|nr:class I SAM-dependent methyltransferase [Flavobacteriaceae bacterium]
MKKINKYLTGEKLIGNDFTIEEIEKWYAEEKEAYADLGSKDEEIYSYEYDVMNKFHGYNKLKEITIFNNVLGIGSAWGHEFIPIINKIRKLTIIEPSDQLVSLKLKHLKPTYIKPSLRGDIPFDSNSFDLITCFGTLHHIPNVAYVLGELIRGLKKDGYLLLREPIISMGDWRHKRIGLTKNERGIPVSFFRTEFSKYSVEIVSEKYCFTTPSLFQRIFGKILKKSIFSYKTYVLFDNFISNLLKNNIHYYSTRNIDKIAPSSIFYVIKKTGIPTKSETNK